MLPKYKPIKKRLRDTPASDLNCEVRSIILQILKIYVNDMTSTIDTASREERIPQVITYRLSRTCLTTCPYKQTHSSNGFYIHLDMSTSTTTVYYKCLSTLCSSEPRVKLDVDSVLLHRWQKLEEACIIDTDSKIISDEESCCTTESPTITSSMSHEEFDNMEIDASDIDDEDGNFKADGNIKADVQPVQAVKLRPESKSPDLIRLVKILKLLPIVSEQRLSKFGFLLKRGLNSTEVGEEPTQQERDMVHDAKLWNQCLVDIWHNMSMLLPTYDETKCQKKWNKFVVPEDSESVTTEQYLASLVTEVCKVRAEFDLDFDEEFVLEIYNVIMKPADVVVAGALHGAREASKEKKRCECAHAYGEMSKEAVDDATDAWREAVDNYVLANGAKNMMVKPAVFMYISKFFTLVASTTKTEVVQRQYHVQTTSGKSQHVMNGFLSRLKGQFIDAHGQIFDLMMDWLKSVPAAAGFTLDPEFVNEKDDGRFKTARKLPMFNTFCGFAIDDQLTPEQARKFEYDQTKVNRVLDHVDLLVNGDPDIKKYVLRWLAAPLQKRGHRTNVMIINRSSAKGVGKGLFWNEFIGGCIYGSLKKDLPHNKSAYSQVKDIDYIVGPHNEGLISKVFLQLDECGIFDGATKQNEKLKGLITEPTVQINQKFLSLITCLNFINFMLTSNKQDPIKIEPGDRRFLLIETLLIKAKSYFVGPGGLRPFLLKTDAAKHFYAYLMQLKMGDFYTSDPPTTDAKESSMARNMPTEAKFLQALTIHLQEALDRAALVNEGEPVTEVLCYVDEEIGTSEFAASKISLSEAFDAYCKANKMTSKGSEALFGCINKTFTVTKKSKTMHFPGQGSIRPVIMPSVGDMQVQLKKADLWDNNFTLDLAPVDKEKPIGLYWGDGIRKL
jgi:Family of unknown function (DUF5906)